MLMGHAHRRRLRKTLLGWVRLRQARYRVLECRALVHDLLHSLTSPSAEFVGVEPRPQEWARAEARLARAQRRLENVAQGRSPFASLRWISAHRRWVGRQEDHQQKHPEVRRGA